MNIGPCSVDSSIVLASYPGRACSKLLRPPNMEANGVRLDSAAQLAALRAEFEAFRGRRWAFKVRLGFGHCVFSSRA